MRTVNRTTHAVDTIEVAISIPSFDHDALLAEISDWELNGVVQEDNDLRLYLPASAWTDAARTALTAWLEESGHPTDVDVRIVPPQNWNAVWEASITPVRAGPFWIKPTWTDLPASADRDDSPLPEPVIEIDPKMSFGTGHHATTRLVLRLLPPAVRPGDHVLDVGTGTGVLAIAACRLGAGSVLGVDIRDAAVENARENVELNDVADRVAIRSGTIATVSDDDFDVVCANVTRDVLLDVLPAIARKTAPGGRLLLVAPPLHLPVDLAGGLHQQEEPAAGQDQVADRHGLAEGLEQRLVQREDPGQAEEEGDAGHHRQPEPQLPGEVPSVLAHAIGQDRDHHDVVDPEHDLQDREGDEGGPGLRAGDPFHGDLPGRGASRAALAAW